MSTRTCLHDAPWLSLRDDAVLHRFCLQGGIDPGASKMIIVNQVAEAFRKVPYENLTKILKADSVISASSAMRYPAEVVSDYLQWGSGGTCFSLTAAVVGLLDALGVDAHPILADRHYGADTHCGLLIAGESGVPLLLDPGFLLFAPVAVPVDTPCSYETGFNRIELTPQCNNTRIELRTIHKGNRKLRLTFKLEAVSDEAFGRAWEHSFAFEMMSYPVLTRYCNGAHHYLQGPMLSINNGTATQRRTLAPNEQIAFIEQAAGISRSIVTRALEIVNYGRNSCVA